MRRFKVIFCLKLAWIALFVPVSVFGQVPPPLPGAVPLATSTLSLSQSVTVSVQEINEITIDGDVNLIISTAMPGAGLDDATDASTATYSVTTNASSKKITGSLDSDFSPGLTLSILLGAPTGALSSLQALSTTAQELVTNIAYLAESSLPITYTATATVNASPNGVGETRVVTLTLMDN